MKQSPYELEGRRRALVLEAIQEVCSRREWMLLAVHVRTHHVHAVVAAPETPEKVMNGMKTYGSRALNQSGLDRVSCRRWAHHGSTRYLWKPEDVASAMEYVVRGQGEPMAVWENPDRPSW